MLKALKRTLLIGCAAAMLLSSSVSAQTGEYNFFLTAGGGSNSTTPRVKENYDSFALITVSQFSGAVATAAFRMETPNWTESSEYVTHSNTDPFVIPYYVNRGWKGDSYLLRGIYYGGVGGSTVPIIVRGTFTP